MKVLSLFDGISCARVALERAGIPVEAYYASEIDKYAIQVSQKNYPGIIQLGSVTDIKSKVLCLSVVYDTLKQYDSNIQNKLSESEMLYWLNQNFSISAKIGTQITNGDASEFTTVQCIEEIWFSKCGVGDIIKTQNTTKSRGNGKEDDKIIQKPILQCGEWWYVYRGDSRSKEKNIFRTNGEEVKEVIYRKNSSISTKTIQHKRIKNKIIGTDKKSDVETRGKEEILDWSKNEKKWSIEAIRDRETQAYYHIENVSLQLPRWNDNERVTEENWNLLQLHKEMETTVVTSSESIDIFTGTFEIMCGGSPCQDLSIAKKDRKGLDGERSGLFWEYVRILREVKPKYFILENVNSMPKEAKDTITEALGVEPIMINASLVSAQNRKRLFFCGQIRERLYFNDVLCYNCLQDENKGILGKTQNKGTEKILGEAPERCGCVQNMQARIQEDRQERNNEDLLIGMSNNKQEKQRQESQQGNQSKVSENVSKEKQRETTRISKEISPIGSGKGENENCGQKTTPNSCEKDEVSLSKRNNRNKKENYERGSLGDTKYETDMFCVSCHKRLNNRPYRSFISGWNEQPRKSPSVMSEMQFNEARQNNGRVFDIYQLEIPQPEDRGILLKDILQSGAEVDERMVVNGKSFAVTASYNGAVAWNSIEKKQRTMVRVGQIGKGGQGDRIYSPDGKSVNLSANGGGRGAKTGLYAVEDKSYCVPSTYYKENVKSLIQRKKKGLMVNENTTIRKLTPIECERLQGLPDNYTEGISNTQRYKCLGNAFNVDVVAHILSFIK